MVITSYIFGIASRVASTDPSTVPGMIAKGYVSYLWNYEPDSWVDKIASSCRVLALLLALPVIVSGGLDIVSYGIARTLGIVDDVKASTSDKATDNLAARETPMIHLTREGTPASDSEDLIQIRRKAVSGPFATRQPKTFYASGSDGLALAGADIFSPAASEPSSPTISRKVLSEEKLTPGVEM